MQIIRLFLDFQEKGGFTGQLGENSKERIVEASKKIYGWAKGMWLETKSYNNIPSNSVILLLLQILLSTCKSYINLRKKPAKVLKNFMQRKKKMKKISSTFEGTNDKD